MHGEARNRTAFAEYHGTGSKSATFMLRQGARKLIYHVGAEAQLFDLDTDPHELTDLAADSAWRGERERLERALRAICDPEGVDAHAKADQKAAAEAFGGTDAILRRGVFRRSPPPGVAPVFS